MMMMVMIMSAFHPPIMRKRCCRACHHGVLETRSTYDRTEHG